ncbi:unnamed protein product, partial [marine sediment metagenome]
EGIGFVEDPTGPLSLWFPLVMGQHPPSGREYVICVDISAGSGASNSALSIGDRKTREKVAEFVDPNTSPEEFAMLAYALGHWLKGDHPLKQAMIRWEDNGPPGAIFRKALLKLGYANIYYRVMNPDEPVSRQSRKPGWWSSPKTKAQLLGHLRQCMRDGSFVNPSEPAIRECAYYCNTKAGSIEHSRSIGAEDPSGAKDSHGDIVIADMQLCEELLGKRGTDRHLPDQEDE